MDFPEPLIHPKHIQFLQTTEESNINEDAGLAPSIRFEYAQKAAEAWGQEMYGKYRVRQLTGWAANYLSKTEGGVERGKNAALSEPNVKQAIVEYVEAGIRRRKLQGYVDSLDFKASFIPGWQGRENRELDYDGDD